MESIIHSFQIILTAAINQYLALDPASEKRLAQLAGLSFAIELRPSQKIILLTFNNQSVAIKCLPHADADATLRATPLQLLTLMMFKSNREQAFNEDIVIDGSAELAQRVIELFDELHIDWEEYLSQMIGDIPSHKTGRLIKSTTSWLKQTKSSLTQNINEYLHEEAQLYPTHEALNDLFADIDLLRMDVDRTEAKINILRARLTQVI